MKTNLRYVAAMICAAILSITVSCNRDPQWKVKGNIEGAEGKMLVLEASNNGFWYPLDTLTLKKNGKFEFVQAAAANPDIYRLTIDGRSVYFPIDSIETITVDANGDSFGSGSTISGTEAAARMMEVDRLVADAYARLGENAASDATFKQKLADIILENPSSNVAYYIINKKLGQKPLYSTSEKIDLRIIGAVANSFDVMRPNDPRTAYLKNLYLSNRQFSATPSTSLVANQVSLFEIDLKNPAGKQVKLSDVASKGDVVLLSFTALTATDGPAFNLELGKIYDRLKGRGFQIYQVAMDPDEFAWKQAARNLPWVSVYNGSNDMKPLIDYNVGALPALFVIDRNGNLVERITEMGTLSSTIEKYL